MAARVEISNGLAIKSLAPAPNDSYAVSTEPCAVIKITGRSLSNSRSSRTTDRPSPSGMTTSQITASYFFVLRSETASRPLEALEMRKPLSDKPVSSVTRIAGSSSTIKICGFSVIQIQDQRLMQDTFDHRFGQIFCETGKWIVKVEPLFSSLAAEICPPCSSAISLANAKPRPVP